VLSHFIWKAPEQGTSPFDLCPRTQPCWNMMGQAMLLNAVLIIVALLLMVFGIWVGAGPSIG
jgi:hypothetical protein